MRHRCSPPDLQFSAAAFIRTSTWPVPGWGFGTSSNFRLRFIASAEAGPRSWRWMRYAREFSVAIRGTRDVGVLMMATALG